MARRWRMVHGYTHSRAAREAEARGEMPLTRAVEAVYQNLKCKEHKIPRKRVRAYLEANCCRGWHHVAGPNRVREVGYYATLLTQKQIRELLSGE
jgi:hypothetical protein